MQQHSCTVLHSTCGLHACHIWQSALQLQHSLIVVLCYVGILARALAVKLQWLALIANSCCG
jgi:hypothetical protein